MLSKHSTWCSSYDLETARFYQKSLELIKRALELIKRALYSIEIERKDDNKKWKSPIFHEINPGIHKKKLWVLSRESATMTRRYSSALQR